MLKPILAKYDENFQSAPSNEEEMKMKMKNSNNNNNTNNIPKNQNLIKAPKTPSNQNKNNTNTLVKSMT